MNYFGLSLHPATSNSPLRCRTNPSCGFFFKKPISKILLFFYLYKNIPRPAKFATLSNDKKKQMNFENIVIIMSKLAQNQKTLRSRMIKVGYRLDSMQQCIYNGYMNQLNNAYYKSYY